MAASLELADPIWSIVKVDRLSFQTKIIINVIVVM